ncbi:hypothetical protein GCM10007103_19610 [Salinimicrobium marinum]|uniref:UPF0145 protein GCM10007103_19610 n=1 Tax=Salinimicrobium marinum TaxID=680283 RepID=A0A918SH57_9FLAO|nr:YbjQ family protein [Salinimicrobium marinum]GHA38314.1 hypothetical protein GCM10007103_19610 [Salinimicrobium marinum]
MNNKKDVLVITTATPSEGKIKKHLMPVTAHVVAATNLFSDFFAGMSDIFGGRSGTYKKQLSAIYSEAIESIKQEAKRIGGNGVVGLKIDIDEISGQGKSMFMITAIGTAVIIEGEGGMKSEKSREVHSNGRVSNEAITRLRYLKVLLAKAEKDQLDYTTETWEFILQNRVKEMYPNIIKKLRVLLANPSGYPQQKVDAFSSNTKNFLQILDIDDQIALIYGTLLENETDDSLSSFLANYIKVEELFRYNEILQLLGSNKLRVQKRGLLISTFDSSYYSIEEEKKLQEISIRIKEVFKMRGSKTTKKQLLTSKEKEVWECECGKVNDMDYTYCTKCQHDLFGFDDRELKPAAAIKIIGNKISLIREALEEVN